ncbi:hypothetical protein MGYG_04623 [Nannizzia gypsea CBS 118893]|uniref:LysM domain-containing protein n=1 Tax=Arthroderma gypseum (strain ATCC MYA-4604 / CBS 118893) TaxID=535722 RepID=E4UU30_ARTGP|nr:hypothetical protein MGYG_04623 [Nannizzia gypsea CBS 118893]EFR01620.1 hypothetical protein MGYG_04623 [Nannizzia gypsea CBS 118893]
MRFQLLILLASALAVAAQSTPEDCVLPSGCGLGLTSNAKTCEEIISLNQIPLELFKELNPGVDCDHLKQGKCYCVDTLEGWKPPGTTLVDSTSMTMSPTAHNMSSTPDNAPTSMPTTSAETSSMATATPTDHGSTAMTTTTAPSASSSQPAPNAAPNPGSLAQAAATYGWLTMFVVMMGYHL